MNFQPINILNHRSTSITNIEDSEINKCGSNYLTYLDKDLIPNFYVLLDNDIDTFNQFSFFYINVDGTVAHVQIISTYTRIPTANGIYYFFNNVASTFNSEGIYQISLGYTDVTDNNDYIEIFDTYNFVDVSADCYHKVTFSNNCNIDGLPIERLDDFKFCFYTSTESSFGRLTPIFEPEFETNVKGEDISTYKRMFVQETFRLFNMNENLLNTIFYASIFDNFEINLAEEEKDKVFRVELSDPTYQGDTCCIFYLDITLIREYKTNSGCCDEVSYTDCLEFDSVEIDSIRDDSYEPVANNNLCYLIREDIMTEPTAWTPHFNEVACGNGQGGWTYSTPLNILNNSTGTYLIYEGGNYVNNMLFNAFVNIVTLPDFTININGKISPGFLGCMFYSIDDGTTFISLPNEYTSAQYTAGFQIVIPNLGSGQTVLLKAEFKLAGCTTVEYMYPFSIMS